jgi:hypothetical protein
VPSICQTSQTVFEESYPVFISNVTLRVPHPATANVLETFLDSLPSNTGFKAVCSLSFEFFDRHSFNESLAIQFAQRCPGLQKLQLGFDMTSLMRFEAGVGGAKCIPEAVDETVIKYRLKEIALLGRDLFLRCGMSSKVVHG